MSLTGGSTSRFGARIRDDPQLELIGLTNNSSSVIGYDAARLNLDGQSNTVMGYGAAALSEQGDFNVVIGTVAGAAGQGDMNTYVGTAAADENEIGSRNAAFGYRAGSRAPQGGSENALLGCESGAASSGTGNVYVGYRAGVEGAGAVATMPQALVGDRNVAVGHSARARGGLAIAVGPGASATAFGSTAVGRGAKASGVGATAIGPSVVAAGDGSLVIMPRRDGLPASFSAPEYLNVYGVLTGFRDEAGVYNVRLGADREAVAIDDGSSRLAVGPHGITLSTHCNVTVTSPLVAAAGLRVAFGDSVFHGGSTHHGDATFRGEAVFSSAAKFTGTVEFDGASLVARRAALDSLSVGGSLSAQVVEVAALLDIRGRAAFRGGLELDSNLTVLGRALLSNVTAHEIEAEQVEADRLFVHGPIEASGALSAGGGVSSGGPVTAPSLAVGGHLEAATCTVGDLRVTGRLVVPASDLALTGVLVLPGLDVEGPLAAGDVRASGDVWADGDVRAGGEVRAASLLVSGSARIEDLAVSGRLALAGSSLAVEGVVALDAVEVSGVVRAAHAIVADLNAGDISAALVRADVFDGSAAYVRGPLSAGDSTLSNLTVLGKISAAADALDLAGKLSLDALDVAGPLVASTIKTGDLDVDGKASFGGDGAFGGDGSFGGDVDVAGDVGVGGSVEVEGDLIAANMQCDRIVCETIVVQGLNTLKVLGNSSLNTADAKFISSDDLLIRNGCTFVNVTVQGSATVEGSLVAAGSFSSAGPAAFGGPLSVEGKLSCAGGAELMGAADFRGAASFGSAASFSGNASFRAASSFAGEVSFAGPTSLAGAAQFTGAVSLGSTSALTLAEGAAAVFRGPVQCAGISCRDVAVAGLASCLDVAASGSVAAGGSVRAGGALEALAGASVLGGLTVSGGASLDAADVGGGLSVGGDGLCRKNLLVEGDLRVNGRLFAQLDAYLGVDVPYEFVQPVTFRKGFFSDDDVLVAGRTSCVGGLFAVDVTADGLEASGKFRSKCNESVFDGALVLSNVQDPFEESHWVVRLEQSASRPDDPAARDFTVRSWLGTSFQVTEDFDPGILNFTGQHRCSLSASGLPCGSGGADWTPDDVAQRGLPPGVLPGMLVSASGDYMDLDGSGAVRVDEAVPRVTLTARPRDPAVFGVVCRLEDPGPKRVYRMASAAFSADKAVPGDRKIVVNSVGEGGMWVCGEGGPVANGDLLCSSSTPGLAMRQGDDLVRSCTAGKATCACDFRCAPPGGDLRQLFGADGSPIGAMAFVGVTYKF